MLVTINESKARTVFLDDTTVIGSGGEAVVHFDPQFPNERAIKMYRDPDLKRERKVGDLVALADRFRDRRHIVMPMFTTDHNGNFQGFEMWRLGNRYRKLSQLFKSDKFRRDFGFTTKVNAQLMLGVGNDLAFFHQMGIKVGDLNSGGIMINELNHAHAWVDMDSVQVGRHPCMVGTLLYLHPELYGVQLDLKPVFKECHDWWSFTVLLCQALLNGIHPLKSGDHPTLVSVQDRAGNGVSVFDPSVTYPSVGVRPEVISDELLHVMVRVFARKFAEPFPLDLLRSYAEMLIECPSCKLWYHASRSQCPGCAQKTVVDMARLAAVFGFDVADLIATQGRILHHQLDGLNAYCVSEEHGNVVFYKKDGANAAVVHTDLQKSNTQGADFGVFAGKLVVCPDPSSETPELKIYDIASGNLTLFKQTTTESFYGGKAVWGSSNRHLYRIAGKAIVCGEFYDGGQYIERYVMDAIKGQTWFTVSCNSTSSGLNDADAMQDMVFGFYRVWGDLKWFIVRRTGKDFVRFHDLPVSPMRKRESMTDFAISFGSTHVLLIRKTKYRGTERTYVDVVSALDGTVVNYVFEGTERWDIIHGKAYFRTTKGSDIVTHPTDKGIVHENLTAQTTKVLDVGKAVTSDDKLDRFGNHILVVKSDRLSLIQTK